MERLPRGVVASAVGVVLAGILGAPAAGTPREPAASPAAEAAAAEEEAFSTPLRIPAEYTDDEITLTAEEAPVEILDGAPTRMWTFDGQFPGPTIRRPAGAETLVTVTNALPEEAGSITVHHHGNPSAAAHDGQPHPEYAIERGEERTYRYELLHHGEPQRGALQWYHDHTHHRTGLNVWMGLAGMFIVEHPLEEELGLPSGEFDVPLMITDRRFDDDNQLVTDQFTAPGRSDVLLHETLGAGWPPFDEITGDRHLVNGTERPYFEVEPRAYRLRVLNASNFRPYNLALSNGQQLTQVATEGGLLPEPVERDAVLLGPAERAEVVIDFSQVAGERLVLESVAAGDEGPLGATSPAVTELMEFRVSPDGEPAAVELPDALRPLPDWVDQASDVPDRVWTFGLNPSQEGKMAWTINGREFDHHRVDARPEAGSIETWMLVNTSPPGFSHYIHLHHTDWVLLSRNGAEPDAWEAGPKETFRIDPGDRILVATRFTEHEGPFMLHCHMLEHEDHGMMSTFEVVPEGEGDLVPLVSTLIGGSGGDGGLPGLPGVPELPDPPDPGLPVLPDEISPTVIAPPLSQSVGYLNDQVAVLAGMGLSFTNLDNTFHDVVAHDRDADNRPLFASDVIGNGETTPVEGVETLDPGTYPFYCSLHPGMTGDLHVVG